MVCVCVAAGTHTAPASNPPRDCPPAQLASLPAWSVCCTSCPHKAADSPPPPSLHPGSLGTLSRDGRTVRFHQLYSSAEAGGGHLVEQPADTTAAGLALELQQVLTLADASQG